MNLGQMEENRNNASSVQGDTNNNSPSTPASRPRPISRDIRQKRTVSRTRTGCSTCKRRKIKCDEHKPSCRNCVKHNVRCGYLEAKNLCGTQRGASSTPTTPVSVPVQRFPNGPPSGGISDTPEPRLNLIDLELLHNFCMFTYTTLSEDAAVRNFWKYTVVRLGVNCDYVMRCILAVSALHMAHYQPEKRDFFVSRAIAYHQTASRTATRLISEMKPEDRENLWIFSILTIYFALGSPRSHDSSLLMGESAFPDWLFLLRGAKLLFRELQSPTNNGHISPLVARGVTRWQASHSAQHANSPLLRDLQSRINASVTDNTLLSIYNYAIDELRMQLSLCVSEGKNSLDLMDAFVWQFVLADSFVPLLANPTQEAAAIFAHFCVILKRFDEHWWLQGWGTVLIARVWEILDSVHRPWIQWVVEEMGWIPP